MIHKAKDSEQLWIYSMGKRFQVRAITDTVQEANIYMERHPETALIACFGPLNVIANQYAGVRDHAIGTQKRYGKTSKEFYHD